MKRHNSPICHFLWKVLLLACCFTNALSAKEFAEFSYTVIDNTIEITRFPNVLTGHIDVPAEIEGLPVTSIRTFSSSGSKFTSISFPSSITNIGPAAFWASKLESVTLPANLTTMGVSTFGSSTSLSSVTIPEGITAIGENAFPYCYSLRNITVPGSVKTIGARAFRNSPISTVNLNEGLTTIGNRAFELCGYGSEHRYHFQFNT
jgi:hypothetical protein